MGADTAGSAAGLHADLAILAAENVRLSRERASWRSRASWAAREAVDVGVEVATVARLLGVTRATVYAWLRDRDG